MQAGAAPLQFKESNLADAVNADAVSTGLRYSFLKAATARQTLSDDLDEILDISSKSTSEMSDSASEFAALVGGKLSSVSVKTRESATPKVENDYDGDAALLCDGVRATVIIPADNVELCRAALALHESTQAVKDLIAKPSKTGLAILNAKVQLSNGLIGEVQFVTPNMFEAMQMTHGSYKKIDSLTSQFADVALPIEVAREIKYLKADCVDSHATGAFLDGLDRYIDKNAATAHCSPALVN